MSQAIGKNRIAAELAATPHGSASISISRLRSRLAPAGSLRESFGRTLVQSIRRAKRIARIGGQLAIRTAGIAFSPSIPETVAKDLRKGSDAPYDLLCLPLDDWASRFMRPQQIARQFARNDYRVFYASRRSLLASPLAVGRIENNIYEFRLPADARRRSSEEVLSEADSHCMLDGVERLVVEGRINAAPVIVQQPFWTPLALQLRKRFGWPIVYDCLDDYPSLYRQGGPILDMERELLHFADLTVTVSDRLREKLSLHSARVAVVRNAVEYDHFAGIGPAAKDGDNIVVGYYGAIGHWFDSRLTARLADLRPGWRFELIGNTFTGDLEPLRPLHNVKFFGEMPYAELPRYMARWHCCMVPFRKNELTQRANPMKVYEMLAAGMPVVSIDVPDLRPIAAANLIELADDAEGFARAIDKLLANESPAAIAARREFAKRNTWEERFREMADAIGSVMPTSANAPGGVSKAPHFKNSGWTLSAKTAAAQANGDTQPVIIKFHNR